MTSNEKREMATLRTRLAEARKGLATIANMEPDEKLELRYAHAFGRAHAEAKIALIMSEDRSVVEA